MKFGETLRQRSIPEWAYYNVDYNGLKHLIKERTTNIKTKPVTIPGQGPSSDAWTQLEAELFPILWQQHERVTLFIKSKCGEIKRRLDQVGKQLNRLTQELPSDAQNVLPLQYTRKYARLVQDSESIGETIQSLSQFANTQRLAFKKILKKYRRWTGSTNLQLRVNNEIFGQPTSLLPPDLSPFLEQLSNVTSNLASMTVPKRRTKVTKELVLDGSSTIATPQQSNCAWLHESTMQKSTLNLDAAFLSVPLGTAGGRATYWIHPDNMSEAEVLLLRHMKHQEPVKQGRPNHQKRTHSAMFDNLQRYVQEQGATTVAQIEGMEGSFASKVALNVLWSEEADAVAITSDLSPVKTKANFPRRTCFVRRTDLPSCLAQAMFSNGDSNRESAKKPVQHGYAELRDFMAQHRDVKPLAEIHSTRDRFVGLNNSKDVGIWAILEQDITMSPLDVTTIGAGLKTSTESTYSIESPEGQAFPYPVLQIRWEFSRVPEIVRAFDNSHLVERVRGFTLETEAIYNICSPQGMPKPLWRTLLGRDIRKVPPAKPKRRRTNESSSHEESLPTTSATSSTDGPSDSNFSNTRIHSSATSTMDSGPNITTPNSPDSTRLTFSEPKPLKQKKHVQLPPMEPNAPTRYWNEFDDSAELSNDSYAVYVSPDEPWSFPGTERASKTFSVSYQVFNKCKTHMTSWLAPPSRGSREREREPLLTHQRAIRDLEDSSDSESNVRATDEIIRRNGGIRTGPRTRYEVRDSRETLIFRTYVAAFLLSYVLLIVSAILENTGRHKAMFEVKTGVIVGVTVALFCGIGGVGLTISRRDPLSWLHRVAVGLAFCLVCAGSGYLLALVGGTK